MSFSDAVTALVNSATDDRAFSDVDSLAEIYRGLAPIRRVFPTIGTEAWEDLFDEAVLRFWKACREGRVQQERNPAGYLVRIARNLAIDHIRSRSKEPVDHKVQDVAAIGDTIATTVDATAGRQAVEAGLRAAWEAQDDTVVRVVLAWLEVAAAQPGAIPSSRKVGEVIGMSHTAVNDAMGRFKRYLPGGASHS
jgi:hypothetical protein